MIAIPGSTKNVWHDRWCYTTLFGLHEKKWKHQISLALIFFNLSLCVWKNNNGLLDQSYWDDFDITDQCHNKDNVSQFCSYLGYLLSCLNNFTLEEVVKAIQKAPSKQCDLDPVPTWLVKKCSDILGPVITGMIKSSFAEGHFPESHKHTLVRSRIK